MMFLREVFQRGETVWPLDDARPHESRKTASAERRPSESTQRNRERAAARNEGFSQFHFYCPLLIRFLNTIADVLTIF